MPRVLLGKVQVNTRDTRSQQWNNEVMQPASRQVIGKHTSAQAQWRHTAVLAITWFVICVVRAAPI
jgi:preprotein translocase subunit SecG